MAEKKIEIDSAKLDLAFEKFKDALFGMQEKATPFEDQLGELKLPEYVMDVVNEEKAKLLGLKPGIEVSKTKNYLDWLTSLPWEKTTEDKKDLEWAEYILEKDLHGMKDVKERILELIAAGMLEQQQRKGKILCLYGLPGVGKKSLAKLIAKAIGRKFCHISAPKMADPSEIRGQRRFDSDAMPGRLIQCLKEAQCANPLILIEDIDKISGLHMEATASALHQIMDPKQNAKFVDHFIEIPFDCSKIIFICTANEYYTIPEHWQRQMKVIELDGYTAEEKLEIAKKYVIPKCQKDCDIIEGKLLLKDDALQMLLNAFCPQIGLYELEEEIGKICLYASRKLHNGEQQVIVSSEHLLNILGAPSFPNDRIHEKTSVGVIMGLAVSLYFGNGVPQYVEAKLRSSCRANNEKQLIMTGNLSDSIKESIEIAFTVVKDFLLENAENDILDKSVVHLHLPDGHGFIPKDGPSFGAAIASAIISRVLKKPAKEGFAMTGVISLTGKILRIGGVKEKLIAAKKAGATHLIFPEGNKANFLKLESFIKEGIEVHFVTEFWQIVQLLFPDWNKDSNSPASSGNDLPQSKTLAPSSDFMADLAKGDGEEGQKDCTDLAKVGGEEEGQKDGTDLAKVGEEVGKDGYEKPFSTINKDEAITTELKELSADMNLPAGEVIPTAGGGTAVQFMDVENLEQETPYDE